MARLCLLLNVCRECLNGLCECVLLLLVQAMLLSCTVDIKKHLRVSSGESDCMW